MPRQLVENYVFIMSMAVLALIAGTVFIVVLASTRAWIWRSNWRRAEGDKRRRAIGPNGKRLPPQSQGVCDRCGKVFADVYYLPDGRALCPGCFAEGPMP